MYIKAKTEIHLNTTFAYYPTEVNIKPTTDFTIRDIENKHKQHPK